MEKTLKGKNVRAQVDTRSEKIGRKIRDTELAKIPYMLIVGEKEMEGKTVGVRKQSAGELGAMNLDSFIALIEKEVNDKVG